MIRAGRAEECELELEKHYEEELPTIRDLLFSQFPKRKAFLEEAFKLHDEGRYVSAIPLFLIQSDGIGQSIFGASPISKGKKSRADLEKWINQRVLGGWALDGFWRCILQILPINADSDKLDVYNDPLNRHGVLHGLDLTYPSRRNSFKAIAWLQYVGSFAMWGGRRGELSYVKAHSRIPCPV
jgi:hypothetical protein